MNLSQIYDLLDAISPFCLQEEWDNSGLQIGSFHDKIAQIYLSLDIDSFILDEVLPNSLIITHHPLLFKGLKTINFNTYPSSLIKKMIDKNISLIAMHTNFDKTHLNEFVASKILGLQILKKEDFALHLEVKKSFNEFCEEVKNAFNIKHLKVVKCCDFIDTAVLTTGSGSEFIPRIKADCFLTGDIKYHDAIFAKENNLSLIDIEHFESEKFFGQALQEELKKNPLKVIITNSKNPFQHK